MKNAREMLIDGATVLAAVCAVALTLLAFTRHRGTRSEPSTVVDERIDERQWNELISSGNRIGPENATLTVVEFGDFECPACASFARVFRRFQKQNPRDVALIFRHWPLAYHKFARAAAVASICAGQQNRFVEFHDLLFEKSDSIGLLQFDTFAQRAGVPDVKSFNFCLSDPQTAKTIEDDMNTVRGLRAKGTPTIVVDGKRLGDIPDEARLRLLLIQARGAVTQAPSGR